MHNFEAIFCKVSQEGIPQTSPPLVWLGVYKQNFKFSMPIMALKRKILSRFFQNFLGGMPPDLPSMSRGLQTNVLKNFLGKKGL